MANRIIEELIQKAKSASVTNRGAYPVTAAANVFKQDGTSLEGIHIPAKLPNEEVPEADVVVDLHEPEHSLITEIIDTAESGAVIAVSDGEVAEELTLCKGIVMQGVNAGIAQNYRQEV